jgi:hypothetical protein
MWQLRFITSTKHNLRGYYLKQVKHRQSARHQPKEVIGRGFRSNRDLEKVFCMKTP